MISDQEIKKSNLTINFSAQTSVNDLQNQMEGFLSQRIKTGVFGPPEGKKAIIFIDDINLPEIETYGAQPPIELIRQWFDYKGWFNLQSEDKEFIKFDRIQFTGCFGPLRNIMTNRLVRHFSQLQMTAYDKESLNRIFQFTIDYVFTKNEFKTETQSLKPKIVDATIQLYDVISTNFKPKPTTIH